MDRHSGDRTDDGSLFRRAMRGVRPHHHDTVVLRGNPPPPEPVQSRRDQQAVLHEMLSGALPAEGSGDGEDRHFHRPGVPRAVLRRLRRGHFAIEDELDLHGLSVEQARESLGAFVKRCSNRGLGCVRVVHGKGRRSPGREPVLKPRVLRWLTQFDEVLAYVAARPNDGGDGAVYVMLKRRRG